MSRNKNKIFKPCPLCEQDYLLNITINYLKQKAVYCPECDSLWLAGTHITRDNALYFETYMQDKNIDVLHRGKTIHTKVTAEQTVA